MDEGLEAAQVLGGQSDVLGRPVLLEALGPPGRGAATPEGVRCLGHRSGLRRGIRELEPVQSRVRAQVQGPPEPGHGKRDCLAVVARRRARSEAEVPHDAHAHAARSDPRVGRSLSPRSASFAACACIGRSRPPGLRSVGRPSRRAPVSPISEERRADLVLESADLPADRRLRDPEARAPGKRLRARRPGPRLHRRS
jgi:hypothetical protein